MGKAKHFIQAKTLEKIHTLTRMKTTKQKSRKSNPLPFYIPFFTKKVPLSYTCCKWFHFHIPCLELCIPFDCCKCSVFFFYIEINLKNSLYIDVVLFFFSFVPPCSGGQ